MEDNFVTKLIHKFKIKGISEESIIRFNNVEKYNGIPLVYFYAAKIDDSVVYAGKVNDIPEEIAKEFVDKMTDAEYQYNNTPYDSNLKTFARYYFNEYGKQVYQFDCETAKESFQTLIELPYCIITKI